MRFYGLDSAHEIYDYLNLDFNKSYFEELAGPCNASEFQFLDKKVLKIELDESIDTAGVIIPDFIYEKGIALISERFKSLLDECGVDYVFYKKIILSKVDYGWEEIFWLAIPPRIDCLDFDKSEISQFLHHAEKICINSKRIGRYKIFKIAGISNVDIILTEDIAEKIRVEDLIGIHVFELN